MPQPNIENFTSRGLLIAVAGTSLDPQVHAVQVIDGKSTTTADESERNVDRPYLTNSPVSLSNHRAKIEGSVEGRVPSDPGENDSTGIPTIAPVALPCAMALVLDRGRKRSTLVPVSTGMALADGSWYHAGTLISPTNMRGDITSMMMEIGKPAMLSFAIEGMYEAETEAALPDFDYSAFALAPTNSTHANSTLRVWSLGNTAIDGLLLWGKTLKVTAGQTVKTHEFTSHRETGVDARKGTFEIVCARPDLDDFNPRAIMKLEELVVFRYRMYEGDAPASLPHDDELLYQELFCRGQITAVEDANIDGKRGYKITGRCIASDDGGDDYGWQFGDCEFKPRAPTLAPTYANGAAFSVQLVAGGDPVGTDFEWAVSSGTMPTGVTLDANTGLMSGTLAGTGTFTWDITVTDEDSNTGTGGFQIVVS